MFTSFQVVAEVTYCHGRVLREDVRPWSQCVLYGARGFDERVVAWHSVLRARVEAIFRVLVKGARCDL